MSRNMRKHSKRQEETVAKIVGGKVVANSGATAFNKGDVVTDDWLFECKTVVEPQETQTIRKEWFDKNKEEARAMRKMFNAIVIDFGYDKEQYFIVDQNIFEELMYIAKEYYEEIS